MSEFRDPSGAARASPAGGDDVEELVFLYLEEREQGLVRGYEDFAIWYTPGVAAPCRAPTGPLPAWW